MTTTSHDDGHYLQARDVREEGVMPPPEPFYEEERDNWPEVAWVGITTDFVRGVLRNDLSLIRYGSRDSALRYLGEKAISAFSYHPAPYGGVVHMLGRHPESPADLTVAISLFGIVPGGVRDEAGNPAIAKMPDGAAQGPWPDADEFMRDFERWLGVAYERHEPPANKANPDLWYFRRRDGGRENTPATPPAIAPAPTPA